jgi:hypothetical protein
MKVVLISLSNPNNIMKTKVNRKEIRSSVKNAISEILLLLNVETPSKKTKKAIKRASEAVSRLLKKDLEKQFRAAEKKTKRNNKALPEIERKTKQVEVY